LTWRTDDHLTSAFTASAGASPRHPTVLTIAAVWVLAAPTVVPTAVWLAVMGALLVGSAQSTPSRRSPAGRRARSWTTVTCGFLGASVVSVVVARSVGPASVAELALFAALPLGAVSVRRTGRLVEGKALWQGALAGALLAGTWSLVEVHFAGADRAAGLTTNAILFGDLALMAGFLAATLAPSVDLRDRRAQLSLAALFAGVLASMLSASRGGWLAIPPLLLVLTWHHRREAGLRQAAAVVACLLLATLVADLAGGRAIARVEAAVQEVHDYRDTPATSAAHATSVGTRLDMWQASVSAFVDRPVTGLGWGNLQEYFTEEAARGEITAEASTKVHAHNQYLSAMANGGALGLLALLALLAVPARWFRVAMRDRDPERRAIGAAGLVVVLSYSTFAMTEGIFERLLPVAVFSIVIAMLAGNLDATERAATAWARSQHPAARGRSGTAGAPQAR
jgi:O-antigen ligase